MSGRGTTIRRALRAFAREIPAAQRLRARTLRRAFETGGCRPWSRGYVAHRDEYISSALEDDDLLALFRQGERLPDGYGAGLDERCVELPWIVARLGGGGGRLLDAGSTLNHAHVVRRPELSQREVHILTLAPEGQAFWRDGISYLYADLREIPIRDGWYDDVACISTLEHVGLDNTMYVAGRKSFEGSRGSDLEAVLELARVLKLGGRLLISVPFGKAQDFGTFRQLDSPALARLVDAFPGSVASRTFYRYRSAGWQVADEAGCTEAEYSAEVARAGMEGRAPNPTRLDEDRAAAARAVACLELRRD